jgi:urea carboxylase
VTYRQAGDRNILIEYGPPVLDLALRFRVAALMQRLEQRRIPGVREITPGIRSLQVQFAGSALSQAGVLAALMQADASLPPVEAMQADSRIIHLPLSWNDSATQLAIDKYMQSVRADAPWCPSNIEFIRRINGLDSIDDVRRIVFEASYLVLGLGDVYLGAPVATPLDPRHRLVTTKYNPARTWTPENAVGIGGAYLCVYGMEGPGGYQFVGRTLQMWNRYRQTEDFCDGKQWLLRFFDQIRFFPVSEADLLDMRSDFLHGRYRLQIEHSTLRLADYLRQLETDRDSIAFFKSRQQAAFDAERDRWSQLAPNANLVRDAEPIAIESTPIAAGCAALLSPVTGSVWAVQTNVGERVKAGQTLAVIEAMKMEVPIVSDTDGWVVELRLSKGGSVANGDVLIVTRPDG